MKFCSQCGNPVTRMIPAGDNRMRHVCAHCATVHYENPRIVAGCLPVWRDQVLLCRRAIEPRRGYWTLPAGFMENGESTAEGALRETLEEACARVEIGDMLTLISVPYIAQVHVVYRARLLDLDFSPGVESLEVVLMGEQDIPWDDIAFRTIAHTLRFYFADRARGEYRFRSLSLDQQGRVLPG